MRIFLAAHAPRFVTVWIIQTRFLRDRAAVLDQGYLPARLALDHRHHETHRIDVLRLGPRAQFCAGPPHADVDVRAHAALIHIAIAAADITQHRTQFRKVSPGLLRAGHIGLADDLHQRHAAAVEIDIGHRRVLIMHQLAGVLLDMDAFDADALASRVGVFVIQTDVDMPLTHNRVVQLADLIALRQIGIEVILAIKPRPCVDHRINRQAGAHRLPHAFAIRHRQHPRHRRIDKADLRVGLRAKGGGAAGEQLGLRGDLGMNLQADHDLPLARGALNAIG